MNDLPLNQVLCGDCSKVMKAFPDDSIDLVVTSPPYWGLRDYGEETIKIWGGSTNCEHVWAESTVKVESGKTRWQHEYGGGGQNRFQKEDNPREALEKERNIHYISQGVCKSCGAWQGSLGLEPHPLMFIDHLTEICHEIKRILKQTGSFWLNLGDTYYGSGGKGGQYAKWMRNKGEPKFFKQGSRSRSNWLQPKQLLGMPWRVAIALQDDGWVLRNSVIWHKPNHMPSSVKDRLTPSYEFFFFFVKARKYYFDLDSIRQPYSDVTIARITQPNVMNQKGGQKQRELRGEGGGNASRNADMVKSLARKIHGPNSGEHNKPPYIQNNLHLFRITEGREAGHLKGKNPGDLWTIPTYPFPAAHFATFPMKLIEPIIKASCPKDGVVLDPFCGSGTVLRVARKLGRSFIGIDVKEEYCEMAKRRVKKDRYRSIPDGVVPLSEFQGNEASDVGVPPKEVTK